MFAERLQARRKRNAAHPRQNMHELSQSCINPPKFHKICVLPRFCALQALGKQLKFRTTENAGLETEGNGCPMPEF